MLSLPVLAKGVSGVVSMDKEALLGLSGITDAYYQDEANLESVLVVYKSGSQQKLLRFDLSAEEPQAIFKASETAHDSFELERVILVDHDSGIFSLDKAHLPSGLDITLE